jgi:hypothetical protein
VNWDELKRFVPYKEPGENQKYHTDRHELLAAQEGAGGQVAVYLPGRHWQQTTPRGGDFVVRVTSAALGWTDHPFAHDDIFEDLAIKRAADPEIAESVLARSLIAVAIEGKDPFQVMPTAALLEGVPGLEPLPLLVGYQALALAEHRRYAAHEPQGGRSLPLRYGIGVIKGYWTATAASRVQRRGSTGLTILRSQHGREPDFHEVMGRQVNWAP